MNTNLDFVTESEALFAEYLRTRDLPFQYEPCDVRGEPNPDFCVTTQEGEVVCEVTELDWFNPPLPPGTRTGVWLDTYSGVRRKLQDKHKQGRHLKGRLPYVVVLAFKSPHPAVPLIIPGAMFGDVAISIQVDPEGGPPPAQPPETIFTGGGRLQAHRLTTISAVSVVQHINPTKAAVERRISERIEHTESVEDVWSIVTEEYAKPGYDEGAGTPRLDTFHNIFAAEPRLPRDVFAGPLDREFDAEGSLYTEVFRGSDYDELVAS